jgi:hypothetical protein
MKLLFISLIVSLSCCLNAQQKFDWSKYKNLPFKLDSVQSFSNQLVQETFIQDIKMSDTDFEIRLYTAPFKNKNAHVRIFKCKGDSCIIENYNCYKNKDSSVEMYLENIGINKEGYFLQRFKKTYNTQINIKKYLVELKKYGFFTMEDQSDLLKTLKRNKIFFVNPCMHQTECFDIPILVEIKMLNNFRNFKMLSIDYFLDNIPPHVTEFENNHYIKILLNNIFKLNNHVNEKK